MFPIFKRDSLGVAALLLVLAGRLQAAENFRLFTQPLLIPERGEVTSYVLLAGTNKFSFLPPPGWHVRPDAAEKTITFMPVDLSASISVKILSGQPEPTNRQPANSEPASPESLQKGKADHWRQQLLDRYPGAKIMEEFRCYTRGNEGVSFDLEQLVGHKISTSSRVAVVSFSGGSVEFVLTTATKKFADYNFAFGNLLTSFSIEPLTLLK